MDKVTRVKNAMDAKPVDRFPASFWFHFMGEKAQGETCVQEHLAYYRKANLDYVKIMSDGFSMPHPLEIQKASDWANVRPAGRQSDFIQGQVTRAKRINEELKGDCCTFYNVFTPFATFKNAVNRDMVGAHLREDPKSFRIALDAWAEDYATLAELVVKEGGCTGSYLALQGAEVDFLKPEEYLDVVRDSDLKVIAGANSVSEYNIAHLCAWFGIKNNLSVWRDYPVKAMNWAVHIEEMDLAAGKAFFGDKCVIGGFDNRKSGTLYSGTEQEIKELALKLGKEYTEKTGDTTGMMLGADCTIWWEVDTTRMQWVMEALNA